MKQVIQKEIIILFWSALLACRFGLIPAYAQQQNDGNIPNVISFSSKINDSEGNFPPDGSYTIKFLLYTDAEGGEPVWTETFNNKRIENGLLQVVLGNDQIVNPITSRLDTRYYLEFEINGSSNQDGRIELTATPYSLAARYAWTVDDEAITTEKIAPLTITSEKIESVEWSKITGDVDPDPYSIYWTIQGNIIYGPERNYLGTIEKKDFVFKSFSIQRMLFDPYGYVVMGTVQDSVNFEIMGDAIYSGDVYIKGKLGVGVDPARAKVHVNSNLITPFKVIHDNGYFVVNTDGSVDMETSVSGDEDNLDSYSLFVDAVEQGIAIQVDGNADNDNNFVSFWNDGKMKGRIEGESYVNWLIDPVNLARDAYIIAATVADAAAIAAAPVEPASIISFSAEVIYNAALIAIELANMGVTYESGSGDYAEWLKKLNPEEIFNAGDIIGLQNGRITKNTSDADNLSCISFSPIILGNKPETGSEDLYEKVAFLGQVPVKVRGAVQNGDYIIPSGLNDGTGVAVPPSMMTIGEYAKIVGRAWQSSESLDLKYINTSIGFNNGQIMELLKAQRKSSDDLESALRNRIQRIEAAKVELLNLETQLDALGLRLENFIREHKNDRSNETVIKKNE